MRDLEALDETRPGPTPAAARDANAPAPAIDFSGVGNATLARAIAAPASRFRPVVPPGATLARAPQGDNLPGMPQRFPFPAGPQQPLQQEEKEFLAELRGKTRFRAGLCFTKYVDAAREVKAEKTATTPASPTLLDLLIDLAVGSLAPGFANFVLTPLRNELKAIAGLAIERIAKNSDNQEAHYLKAEALVDKYIDNAALSAQAWTALKGLWGPSEVRASGSVGELLDGFIEEFSVYLDDLSGKLASLSPADQLGAYAAFEPKKATKSFYKRQITDLVEQHQALDKAAAPPRESGALGFEDAEQIVIVHAFGVSRPAIVNPAERRDDVAPYTFVRWVSDEMAERAKARGAEQTGISKDGGQVRTHVGLVSVADSESYRPDRDAGVVLGVSAPWQGRQYAEIVDGERVRIANVEIDADRSPRFISWVEPADEHYARAKGERQFGGLKRFDAAQLGAQAAGKAAQEAAAAVGG